MVFLKLLIYFGLETLLRIAFKLFTYFLCLVVTDIVLTSSFVESWGTDDLSFDTRILFNLVGIPKGILSERSSTGFTLLPEEVIGFLNEETE